MVDVISTDKVVKDSHILATNSLILLSRRMMLWVFSGVMILFLPRYLGAEGLGQLAFAISFVGLFTTALSFGLSKYLVKQVARDKSIITTHLVAAIGIRAIAAFMVAAIIVSITLFFGLGGDSVGLIYVAAAVAIATSFAAVLKSVIRGVENMGWPALSEVASRLLIVVVGIPVLVNGMGVVAYASVLFAAALVNVGLNAGYVVTHFKIDIDLRPKRFKSLIVGGAPFIMMGVLLDVYGQTDIVVLRIFTNDTVVGWYAAANNIYKTIDLLPVILTGALLPTLSRIHHEGNGVSISMAKKSLFIVGLVIIPISLGISMLSNQIIDTLPYPDSFSNTIPLLTILALTIPITAFLIIFGTIAIAVDRQKAWASALLATTVLNVLLNVIAAPYFQEHYGNGGIGVALTTLATELFMVVVGIWLMPKGVIDRTLVVNFLKIGVSAGLMVLAMLAVRGLGLGTIPIIVTGGVSYVAFVFATRIPLGEDIQWIAEFMLVKLRRGKHAC